MKIKIAIIGASGYTGVELIRLLQDHPHVKIEALIASSNAGNDIAQIYPHLAYFKELPQKMIALDEFDANSVDLVFCCLPHATSQMVIKKLFHDNPRLKIIDLSADFRLRDIEQYQKWYHHEHQAIELQKEAVYGLAESYRSEIKNARLVANPGCYPTSASLPLMPLIKAGLIEKSGIIIDAKSGVSGAGRGVKQANLFTEINDGIRAYGISTHRHTPEIEQNLGGDVEVQFTPQLVPMNRGILSNIYVKANNVGMIRECLEDVYNQEYFIHIAADGYLPSTRDVYGTNHSIIAITAGRFKDMVVLTCVIDNLVKGASGQAIQNMNIIFGFEEKNGLMQIPIFP